MSLKFLLPGKKSEVDVSDSVQKTAKEKEDVREIVDRTDRLERLWMVDDLFPRPERRNNGQASIR